MLSPKCRPRGRGQILSLAPLPPPLLRWKQQSGMRSDRGRCATSVSLACELHMETSFTAAAAAVDTRPMWCYVTVVARVIKSTAPRKHGVQHSDANKASVQSTLARGRVAIRSALAATNAIFRRVRYAGSSTFALPRYVTIGTCRLKSAPPRGISAPHIIHMGSLGPRESTHQTASRSVQLFLLAQLARTCAQHKDGQTHRACYVRHL